MRTPSRKLRFFTPKTFSIGKDFYFMSYIRQHKYHFVALATLIIIAGISWKLSAENKNQSKISNFQFPISKQTTNSKSQIPNANNSLTIQQFNNSTESSLITSYQLQVTNTSTAIEAMKGAELNFKTKNFSDLGEFVEEINGMKNDPHAGKYWMYFINGESAKLGISTQIVKPGDLIEWKYGNID